MARQVDIWWIIKGGRLKASMRWTNKRGRISFTLIPSSGGASCDKCPFKVNLICSKWREEEIDIYNPGHLCSMLWIMEGDNQFEGRDEIIGWQPLGPVKRERKKNRKI